MLDNLKLRGSLYFTEHFLSQMCEWTIHYKNMQIWTKHRHPVGYLKWIDDALKWLHFARSRAILNHSGDIYKDKISPLTDEIIYVLEMVYEMRSEISESYKNRNKFT